MMKKRAKPYLEKALKFNKNFQPAILALASLLVEDEDTLKAIELLRRLADFRPTSEVYTRIGEIYVQRNEGIKAFQYYTDAIKYVNFIRSHFYGKITIERY